MSSGGRGGGRWDGGRRGAGGKGIGGATAPSWKKASGANLSAKSKKEYLRWKREQKREKQDEEDDSWGEPEDTANAAGAGAEGAAAAGVAAGGGSTWVDPRRAPGETDSDEEQEDGAQPEVRGRGQRACGAWQQGSVPSQGRAKNMPPTAAVFL